MRSSLPPFPALQTFLAVARTGGVRAAAKVLNVTDSAVSHQLRKLEDHLGAPLTERHGRGLRLTPLGQRYADQLAMPLSEIASVTDRLFGTVDPGSVVLTAAPAVASLGLIPFIGRLEAEAPNVVLRFVTTMRLLDLDAMGINLALRYERRPADAADPLSFPEYAFPVCSPALAEKGPETVLSERRLLNAAHAGDWQRWAEATDRSIDPRTETMHFDSSEMAVSAALQGMGVAIGRTPIVNQHLASGSLVAPFGTDTCGEGAYRIVLSSGGRRGHVGAVIEWLAEVLTAVPARAVE